MSIYMVAECHNCKEVAKIENTSKFPVSPVGWVRLIAHDMSGYDFCSYECLLQAVKGGKL